MWKCESFDYLFHYTDQSPWNFLNCETFFEVRYINYASCITKISPWSLFHGNIFLTLCFFNIQEETRTIYMDKFFHVFTLHSSSLLCSDNMLSPELSPVLCTAIRLQATNISATLEPLLQTTTIVIVEPCALNAEALHFILRFLAKVLDSQLM